METINNDTTPIRVKKIRDSSLRLEPVTSDEETPEIDEETPEIDGGTLKTAMSDIQTENYMKQKLREMYSCDSPLDTSYKEQNRRFNRVCYYDVPNLVARLRLLHASKLSHPRNDLDIEIEEIIQELKDRGVIK